eukprot:1833053-Pyramimonas_sp.AAC.1
MVTIHCVTRILRSAAWNNALRYDAVHDCPRAQARARAMRRPHGFTMHDSALRPSKGEWNNGSSPFSFGQ